MSKPTAAKCDRNAAMLNRVQAEAAAATHLAKLYDRVCEAVVGIGGYCLAWIGLAEANAGQRAYPVAFAGYHDGYLSRGDEAWAEDEAGLGPTSAAISEKDVQVCNSIPDAADDSRLWRARALKRGYAACIALPLMERDSVFGVLTVYALDEGAFGEAEIKILTRLAGDLSAAVGRLRQEIQRTLERSSHTESSIT